MYAIKRIDQGGGYVAQPGNKSSYTKSIKRIRVYPDKESAEADLCIENEIVINIYDLLPSYY